MKIFLIFCCCYLLVGCGQAGRLYLPDCPTTSPCDTPPHYR